MSTKVIKLQDNENNVLLPVTDAKLVQMKVENETKSVQDVIIENELITARALTDLNDTKQDVIDDLDEIRSGAALGETALQTETQLSKGTTGSGNAVTDISVNNHQITLTKGATFLTEHQDLSSYADGAEYDSTNHYIYLKHGNTRLSNPINASDFIKDGMVDTVEVTEGNLVITFNTDSGKEDIEIPLSDIFDPSLYYTKEEIDEHELVTARSLTELHDTKQELLTFDTTPTSNSTNPVTSGGIKTVLDNKVDKIDLTIVCPNLLQELEPTLESQIPITLSNTAYTEYLSLENYNGATVFLDGEGAYTLTRYKYYDHDDDNEVGYLTSIIRIDDAGYGYAQTTIFQIWEMVDEIQHDATYHHFLLRMKSFYIEPFSTIDSYYEGPVASNAVYTALNGKQDTLVSGTNIKTINSTSLLGSGDISVQAPLTFDSTPTANSQNPVTSGGIKTALNIKADKTELPLVVNMDGALTCDTSIADIYTAYSTGRVVQMKLDILLILSLVRSSSSEATFAVTADGSSLTISGTNENGSDVWTLDNFTAQEELTFDSTPTTDSQNPVTSEGIKEYVDDAIDASTPMTEITYSDLVTARNNNNLKPGILYRITDYQCTTTQENTQSAGHQFDIVLLALSENKLAEEGWAMMHDNIYDVTFYDGFTKKCYLYVTSISEDEDDGKIYEDWNLIDIDTMLGVRLDDVVRGESAFVDDNNKQVSFGPGAVNPSTFALDTPNLTYNYFQNSNLSAWKVWYCLDNDTSRFAWADDSKDATVPSKITSAGSGLELEFEFLDTQEVGGVTYYRWYGGTIDCTLSATPNVGDDIYKIISNSAVKQNYKVLSFTPGHEGKYVPSEISIETPSIFDEGEAETNVYKRNPSGDREKNGIKYYQWRFSSSYYYTTKTVPSVGDPLYIRQSSNYVIDDEASLVGFTPGVDAEVGRGVIYRLIDEWNNDCPYDFKNIQFKRWAITALTSGSDEMKAALIYDADENPVYFGAKAYDSPVISGATLDDDNYIFAYTFDGALKDAEGNITHYDVSAAPFVGPQEFIDYMIEQEMGEGIADVCYDNFIGNYGEMDIEGYNLAPGLTLPDNVFFNSSYCYFDEDEDYWSYAFANCYGNSLKSYCSNNTFGNSCLRNTFGNSFFANTFGNSCQSNTFGNWFSQNTFGNKCGNNTFGNYCQSNTFGNDFFNNTFGNSCSNNTFGNYCQSNTFGNGCSGNTFGNNAEKCSVGDGVQNITVSKDFMRYVIIENGNKKITITSNKTTSSSAYLQNFLIALGVNNSNNPKTISHNTVGDAFRTIYQPANSQTVSV